MRPADPTAAEIGAVLAGFAGIALVITFPLVFHLTTYLPNDLGDPVLNAWILWWDATVIRNGLHQLWDAPSFHPYMHTLAYSDHLLGIAGADGAAAVADRESGARLQPRVHRLVRECRHRHVPARTGRDGTTRRGGGGGGDLSHSRRFEWRISHTCSG